MGRLPHIEVRLLRFGPGGGEEIITLGSAPPVLPEAGRGTGPVRMMQIEPDGTERIIEIGPAPAGGERAKRRKKGRGRGGVKNRVDGTRPRGIPSSRSTRFAKRPKPPKEPHA